MVENMAMVPLNFAMIGVLWRCWLDQCNKDGTEAPHKSKQLERHQYRRNKETSLQVRLQSTTARYILVGI